MRIKLNEPFHTHQLLKRARGSVEQAKRKTTHLGTIPTGCAMIRNQSQFFAEQLANYTNGLDLLGFAVTGELVHIIQQCCQPIRIIFNIAHTDLFNKIVAPTPVGEHWYMLHVEQRIHKQLTKTNTRDTQYRCAQCWVIVNDLLDVRYLAQLITRAHI